LKKLMEAAGCIAMITVILILGWLAKDILFGIGYH